MLIKRQHLPLIALVLALLACNMPGGEIPAAQPTDSGPAAVFTAAAQTVEAQLTQSAAAQQLPSATPGSNELPTNTPEPATQAPAATLAPPTNIPPANTAAAGNTASAGSSATPTQSCDKIKFISDVTVPDGTTFKPNETFTKTWRIKNDGTCSWTPSYALVYFSGEGMSGPTSVAMPGNVNPGDTVDLSITLKAPAKDGNYTGYWKLRNAAGVMFGQVYAQIKVGDGNSSSGGKFAVTSVELSVAGSCGNFTITAKITANGAGNVTYKWIRSDGATDTVNHPAIEFSEAGSKTVSTTWAVSAAGAKWMDIYIDKPNHQQFGRANFSCP